MPRQKTPDHDAALARRAVPQKALIADGLCDNCEMPMVFALQSGDEVFTVDLRSILQCLKLAADHHHVPPLGHEWWWAVNNLYDV